MQGLELLAALSFLATLVAGFAVGGRLLWLARESHRAAESFLGLAVTALALAAVGEVVAMEMARGGDVRSAYPLEVIALFLHSASASSLSFAIWRVFHPDRRWAFYLCVLTSALLFDSWMAVILPGSHTSVTGFTNWFHLHVASRAFASTWGAIAALLYHRRLRRRLALSLVDRFTCHRFGLWGFALACTAGILATALFTNIAKGVLVFAWTPALLGVSVLGLLGAWALWFAFLPPAFYVRRVEGRTRVAAPGGLA
jgi:hypothetical protein